MWMTSCTGSARGRFGGYWRKSVSWVLRSEEEGWLSQARRGPCGGCHMCWGERADGKTSIERLCLSPYVETFNSKVIKGFVPEQRSRECFRVSGFLCSMYICYEHSMYISRIHIWLCYIFSNLKQNEGIGIVCLVINSHVYPLYIEAPHISLNEYSDFLFRKIP